MQITFTHKQQKPAITLQGGSEVKLYAVPTAYSNDGYFAAIWTRGELEPVPACASQEALILAHLKQGASMESPEVLTEIYLAGGVTYATN